MDVTTIKSLLSKKKLSSDDELIIRETYSYIFKKKMLLKNSNCSNCYTDALYEILNYKNNGICEVEFNGRIIKTISK